MIFLSDTGGSKTGTAGTATIYSNKERITHILHHSRIAEKRPTKDGKEKRAVRNENAAI